MSHHRPSKRSIPSSDEEVHYHTSHNTTSNWPPSIRPHSTSPFNESSLQSPWPPSILKGSDNCSEREESVTSVTSVFTAVESLNREIEMLQAQMTSIQKAIEQLIALYSPLKYSIDSLFKKLSNLSPTLSPTKSDFKDHLRKRQVFLRNFAHSLDDSGSLEELCMDLDCPFPPSNFFRLKGEGEIRPLILTFLSADHAVSFLRYLSLRKKEGKFAALIARPNYTREEETVYKSKWAFACSKNDSIGRREFVVRNLEVVRLNQPGEWTRIVRPIL